MIGSLRKLVSNGGSFHSSAQTVVTMGLTLLFGLISGIITARALGPAGRGELTAVMTIGQTIGWVVSMGCFQAVVYHCAKNRESSSDVVATWIAIVIPAGIFGIVVGELLVSTLLREQSAETIELARLWLLLLPLNPLSEALAGALVAQRDFAATNLLRLGQQAISVTVLLTLLLIGELTVTTAVVAQAIVVVSYILLLTIRVQSRVRIGRPRRHLATTGAWFGLRAHSSNLGGQVNARFDLMIMPAFLPAAQIGLYAVAVSATSMIISLASSLCQIVQPVAASGEEGSDRQVEKLFHATIMLGLLLAVPVALLAPWLLTLIYSSAFESAALPLRILAPGAVLLAMTNVLVSGLFGKNRPATGGIAQVPGAIFMVTMLLLFLSSGGIVLAAAVSTTAYAISTVVASFAYLRVSESRARDLFDFRPTAPELLARTRLLIRPASRAVSAGQAP